MKITSENYGIVHAYAQCKDCEWNEAIDIGESNRMGKLRTKIYSHVRKTGHSISLETATSITYYKEN